MACERMAATCATLPHARMCVEAGEGGGGDVSAAGGFDLEGLIRTAVTKLIEEGLVLCRLGAFLRLFQAPQVTGGDV